ncbi:MAG: hypothetical protein Q9184_000921 [Pyrenodesmia sp. 2 TL-2023]
MSISQIMLFRSKPWKSVPLLVHHVDSAHPLQLLRTKRIYTRTAVFTAPKSFCVAIIQDITGPSLNKHLVLNILIHTQDIQTVVRRSKSVAVTAEVKCYLQNIVTFLRLHRAVDGGITPRATKYFDALITCLAPLHGLRFVTPSLVDLAARKVYPHRIVLTVPDRERSLQYGSDLAAVSAYLEGVTPESIVEDVIASVETPL